jgi:hybrid cluster-associated redox disulfide protein
MPVKKNSKKLKSASKNPEVKVSKTMALGEIIQKFPNSAQLLAEAGLHCIGCHVSAFETLEQGCKAHDLSDKEIEELVKRINSTV